MNIKKLKVRTRKARYETICAPQLMAMLGCWAASGDIMSSSEECAKAASALHECMRTTPGLPLRPRSTINYHLARLQKVMK